MDTTQATAGTSATDVTTPTCGHRSIVRSEDASKYARYAEPEHRAAVSLAEAEPAGFAHVVVIPCYGERQSLWDAIASIPCQQRVLLIVVLNARADSPAWVHTNNYWTRAALQQRHGGGAPLMYRPEGPTAQGGARSAGEGVGIDVYRAPFGRLVCIDRARAPHWLPAGQGVGLARKIGCDLAWAAWRQGSVRSPWIHCTDADVRLPADYFAQTAALSDGPVAAVYNFVHDVDNAAPALAAATRAYEAWLQHYVDGLREAGSPYAYHSIGSTIAMRARAYAQVRGFPRRAAGEDFYLLDKLRKLGPIAALHTAGGGRIHIAGRISQRVPFGTGKALWRLVTCPDATLRMYHPETFVYLRAWLSILTRSSAAPIDVAEACTAADVPDAQRLARVVARLGGAAAVAQAHRKTRTQAARERYLHTWFDAFRTLKFVHLLRDDGLGLHLPARQATSASPCKTPS